MIRHIGQVVITERYRKLGSPTGCQMMSDVPPEAPAEGYIPKRRFYRPETLYGMVAREISEAILRGEWQRGSTIPGEHEIAAQYGISVGTVRRALSTLVSSGFLERRPRHGTIVADKSPHHNLGFLFHYYRLHGDDDSLLTSVPRTLSLHQAAPTDAEKAGLNLAAGDQVIRIHRVRSVHGKPAAHDVMSLPAARYPDFPAVDDLPHRILSLLEDQYGVRFNLARERVWADAANAVDSHLLSVPVGTPLLVIDHVAYDKAHLPIEMHSGRYISEGFRYINEIR